MSAEHTNISSNLSCDCLTGFAVMFSIMLHFISSLKADFMKNVSLGNQIINHNLGVNIKDQRLLIFFAEFSNNYAINLAV